MDGSQQDDIADAEISAVTQPEDGKTENQRGREPKFSPSAPEQEHGQSAAHRHSIPSHNTMHAKHAAEERPLPKAVIIARIVLRSILMPILSVLLLGGTLLGLQWGVHGDVPAKGFQAWETGDLFSRQALFDPQNGYMTPLLQGQKLFLNLLVIVLFDLAIFLLINHFWPAFALCATLAVIASVAERIKCALRTEPILPTDITLAARMSKEVGSFVPDKYIPLIHRAILTIILIWLICLLLWFLLGNDKINQFSKPAIRIPTQIISVVIPCLLLGIYSSGLGTVNSPIYRAARNRGDQPLLFLSIMDASRNGAPVSFLRFANTTVMDRPTGYSRATMTKVAERYQAEAAKINTERPRKLTDTTVITVLSESFSDPSRVPGLQLSQNPIPNLTALKNTSTSGLMLSSGYGGGTANLEYQELTGLSTALFNPSLVTPYMQLVPRQRTAYSNNQLWNVASGQEPNPTGKKKTTDSQKATGSFAVHPYSGTTYSRRDDFIQKFLFRYFFTGDGPVSTRIPGEHQKPIDHSTYISDASAYAETTARLRQIPADHQIYIQLSTMQNHSPYTGVYGENDFTASSNRYTLSDGEKENVDGYLQGVSHTDTATATWLQQLDTLDRPIVVVWYGDHLPGIYDAEIADSKNTIAMHETDYFIWSNGAAIRAGALKKLPSRDSAYTSPNFFIAQAAQQANAKVSPFIAFLTRMHETIPAMEPTLQMSGDFSSNTNITPNTYLSDSGKVISTGKLSRRQKQMLEDYRLIQYDMTAGRGYLVSSGFTRLPK